MDFAGWLSAVCQIFQIPQTPVAGGGPTADPPFNQIYPRAIEYTELRLQRELDLVSSTVTNEAGTLTPNSRSFTLPTTTGQWVVVDEIYLLISGVRQPPLLPVARSYIDFVWPSDTAASAASVPDCWTLVDQTSILVGGPPGSAFGVGVVGTQRFTPLSPTNTTNFLSLYLPDLYVAASCIWLSGYQRDFGAQSDDPKMAQSWELQYGKLMDGASMEEFRKQFQSVGWSPKQPPKLATPPQT